MYVVYISSRSVHSFRPTVLYSPPAPAPAPALSTLRVIDIKGQSMLT